jgi:membrane protease subunit (stomatin/prohibitin family)
MSFQTKVIGSATALILSTALAVSVPAQASDAGAFVGGMLTSRVLGNMHQRTEAEQQQAYYAQQNSQQQQQVQQAAPAAPAAQTPTQRINELDKLAAGGYITPAEYKKKKQAIVDSM